MAGEGGGSAPRARPATEADLDEVVRLAGVMYRSMGVEIEGTGWRAAARWAVGERLGRDVAAFVIDAPDGRGLVASGVGVVQRRLPGPRNLVAEVGYVQWVATDEPFRGQGLARAVLSALLEWFEAEGVGPVELHATAMAEPLYRTLGFEEGPNVALRRFR